MQNEIPKPLMIGIVALVAILVIGIGYVCLADKPPTKEFNKVGREKLPPPPAKVAVPDWVRQKLSNAPAAGP